MVAAESVRQTRPPDAVRCQISAFLLSGARLYVFAVIGHAGRRIRILGATAHPTASWVAQAARDFVMDLEDADCRSRFMIRDRDGKYPALFDTVLEDAGDRGRTQRGPDVADERAHGTLGATSAFVVGVVAEGIGKGIPTMAMPCVNAAYASHRALDRSVTELREQGITVLYGEGGFEPNPPGSGSPKGYPWDVALEAAKQKADKA